MMTSTEKVAQKEVTTNPLRARVVAMSKDGKSARVEVPRVVLDKTYGKRLHRVISLQVDTGKKEVKVGGLVNILPCRRISKMKSWTVVSLAE